MKSILVFAALTLSTGCFGSSAAAERDAGPLPADASDPHSWAFHALSEAHKTAVTVQDAHRRARLLGQVAAALTRLGEPAAARDVAKDGLLAAREIADPSLREPALRDLAIDQARCDDVGGALRTLEEIRAPQHRDAVRVAIVDAQVSSDELSSAVSNAHAISTPILKSQALRRVAVAHGKQVGVGAGRDIAMRIQDSAVRAMAVADIAALHADIGNSQALESARQIARTISQTSQRDAALAYVAAVQADSGDLQGALATSATIRGVASRADALVRIAEARLRARDPSQVPDLLQRALTAVAKPKPDTATVGVMCEIARGFLRVDAPAQAKSTVESALELATSSRKLRQNPAIFESIARAQARTGDIAGALVTADRVPPGGSRSLLIHDILAAQAEVGDVRDAITTAQSFEDTELRISALFGIIGAQTASGDVSGARESLQVALSSARETRDPGFRSHSLGAIAAAQVKVGDVSSGRSSFQEALAAADESIEPDQKARAHLNLADPFTSR